MGENKYWKSLQERDQTPEFIKESSREFAEELPVGSELENASSSRRDFLKFLGFSVTAATVAASCEMPVRKSIPYLVKPDEVVPGIANYYASSYFSRGSYESLLVKTREGRPIKIEGNSLSQVTGGGTSAAGQASVLSLYSTSRPKGPSKNNEKITWADLDKEVIGKLEGIAAKGANIRLLASTVASPSLNAAIEAFKTKYPTTEVVIYDAVSYSGILNANESSFGVRAIPSYNFDKADVVVSLGADFLGTWVSPVEFANAYGKRRKVSPTQTNMNRHIQVESYMSLTGCNADTRVVVKPSQEALATLVLHNQIAAKTGGATISGVPSLEGDTSAAIASIAKELLSARGKSLVVSGSNDENVQTVVNSINNMLGNYGTTISFDSTYNLRKGDDKAVAKLISDMNAGNVAALIVLDSNPAYSLPNAEEFEKGLAKVELSISLNDVIDETSAVAAYHAPDNHYLESWGDVEPKTGHYSIVQPAIEPLFDTRQAGSSLLHWAGQDGNYYNFVRKYWNDNIFTQQSSFATFDALWDRSVHDGVFSVAPATTEAVTFAGDASSAGAAVKSSLNTGGTEIVFYEKIAIGEGKDADNPWLQELPDPVSKICWDNYACVSEKFAKEKGWNYALLKEKDSTGNRKFTLSEGTSIGFYNEVIKISVNGKVVSLPVFIMPGTADNTIAVAVGYGRKVAGKAAEGVGQNVYPLIGMVNGSYSRIATGAQIETTAETYPLAQTQTHGSINDGLNQRPIVKETTLAEYKKDPSSGNHDRKEVQKHLQTLYGYHDYNGLKWELAVDLNSCFGCGACVIACNAENNVPVVGKMEVARAREMHWLRIDRYFAGDSSNPSVIFQPMMCQHCDNAPCENVCPVSATNHSSEGLNQMAYNRCIGTRYCANNCPYKVRRFNWFDYLGADSFTLTGALQNNHDPYGMTEDLTRMVLNPDVTVRSRGVMEKCSFCVQKIQEGKLAAKKAGRPLKDGEVKTACQAACTTGAIVFGDVNNKETEVHKMFSDERAFKVIEEIHTLPSVTYLTKVRNKPAENKA